MICTLEEQSRKEAAGDVPDTCVKAALFGDTGPAGETLEGVYGPCHLRSIRQRTHLYPAIITSDNFDQCLPDLREIKVIFCTWGMFALTEAHLKQLPALRAVFYAAGSVRSFARPLLRRKITVVSGWASNAVPVAELTLAQILLSNKGYFLNRREFTGPDQFKSAFRGRGNYGATVALLGAGAIGRKVIELLRPFHLQVIVFDPFISEDQARSLGVEKVTMEEAFARGDVVSNHLADVPGTRNILNASLFASMLKHATFINSGRGGTVAEKDLIDVLRMRTDLTALLDVTDPEPPVAQSPLWSLPNVQLSSHIAGAIGDEVGRVVDIIMEEFQAWEQGKPLRYAVTEAMLATMA